MKDIGDYAFEGSALESISFEDGSFLEKIGVMAFANTTSLRSIIIPASVKDMGCYAFEGSALESISFEEGSALERIGNEAFPGHLCPVNIW